MYVGGAVGSVQRDQFERIQTFCWYTLTESREEGGTDSPVCGYDRKAAGEDSCRPFDSLISELRDVRFGRDAATV